MLSPCHASAEVDAAAPAAAAADRTCAVVPAFQAERTVGEVVRALCDVVEIAEVIVVCDGSSDRTEDEAARAGARVVSHAQNRGKGAAIRTGLVVADALGYGAAVTVDADG